MLLYKPPSLSLYHIRSLSSQILMCVCVEEKLLLKIIYPLISIPKSCLPLFVCISFSHSHVWLYVCVFCVCTFVCMYDSRIRLLILIRLVILFFTTNIITPTVYCFLLCSPRNCYLLLALMLLS